MPKPVDLSDLTDAGSKPGHVDLSDLAEPSAKPKPLGALSEIGHEFMEAGRDNVRVVKEAEGRQAAKDKRVSSGHADVADFLPDYHALTDTAQFAGNALAQIASPVTGLLTSAAGGPVETLTGGKVPRKVTGDVLSMAMPFAQEGVALRDISALSKQLGVTERTAKQILDRVTKAGTGKPGLLERTGAKLAEKTFQSPEQKVEYSKNVAALERTGGKPSLAVSHPNKDVRQVAQQLGQSTAIGEPVRRAVRDTVHTVSEASEEAARRLGKPRSAAGAGKIVKDAAKTFAKASAPGERAAREGLSPEAQDAVTAAARRGKSRDMGFGRKADVLYEDVDRKVGPPGAAVSMPHTQAALNDIRYRINDPAFAGFQEHPKVAELTQRLEEQGGKMSFSGARRLRTLIRETLRADPALKATASEAEIENLYQAMTRDLSEGAEKLGGKEARRGLEQTDAYYKAGRARIENALDQTFGDAQPAAVFHELLTDAREGRGEDLKRLMQVRRSLKPEEWRDVAASVIDQMGRALPGQRTAETPDSFRTFLTSFNKLAGDERHLSEASQVDSGLKVLFQGAGMEETYPFIQDIARAASQLREADKLYNHSLTAPTIANAATAGEAGGAAFAAVTGHPGAALAAMLPLIAGRGMSMVLESPKVARFVAQVARNPDMTMAEEMRRLDRAARSDPELAEFRKAIVPAGAAVSLERPEDEPAP